MWPFSRKPDAYKLALAEVKSLPEPARQAEPEPPLLPPVALEQNFQTQFAPPPSIDKYPVIIGQNLTGAYVSSAFRLCNQGWRYQYVDLLDELLENDPDARAVVRARILGIACGRYTIEPANLGESATEQERDLAKAIADDYALEWDSIPYRTQRIQQLAWASWYGVAGHEIKWEHQEQSRWDVLDLCHIHSRRLNYTDPYSWDVHVYDQGLVSQYAQGSGAPTNGVYGLRVSRYPGKFLIHTPALSGQYPTRDGEGRYVAFYLLLKRMITRATAQDFERVIRPWVLGYFNRKIQEGNELPIADKADISMLSAALQAFGSGSMNSAALPNSVKVELLRAAAAMTAGDFLSYLNRSIAKAMLGQAFTTEPGPNGNLATAEVADKNTSKILEYDAGSMCDTLQMGIGRPWLYLNHPGVSRRFCPRHVANVTDLPSAKELMAMAKDGTSIGMPIEISDLAQRTTLKVVADDDEDTPRTRMVTAKDGPNPPEPGQPDPKTQGEQKPAGKLVNIKPNGKAAAPKPEA